MQFGEKVRTLRQQAGLTQPELAERLNIELSEAAAATVLERVKSESRLRKNTISDVTFQNIVEQVRRENEQVTDRA